MFSYIEYVLYVKYYFRVKILFSHLLFVLLGDEKLNITAFQLQSGDDGHEINKHVMANMFEYEGINLNEYYDV